VVEMLPQVMPQMIDFDMASIVAKHLASKGIDIWLERKVEEISAKSGGVEMLISGEKVDCDICIIASGVRPDIALTRETGISVKQGIKVNSRMETNIKDIYACGDCCESVCGVTGMSVLSQLGTTAVRQAKVVAANIAGCDMEFTPTFNTAITELSGLKIGSVGLTSKRTSEMEIDFVESKFKGKTLPEYYPGGKEIYIKLLIDKDKRVIGAQFVGEQGVLTRVDTISVVIQMGGDLDFLCNFETAYTPPLSPTVDPISRAAEFVLRKWERKFNKC
ncbi:MAG: FAD-dependent oxidoreductase, partial [Candidatus Methanofastidiosia archaeon]